MVIYSPDSSAIGDRRPVEQRSKLQVPSSASIAPKAQDRSSVQGFFFPHGASMPPKIRRAEGIYYWSDDGQRYIDAASGPVAVNIGHGNPRILAAIAEQAQQVAFAFPLNFQSESSLEFSHALLRASGSRYQHVYVTSGGSEAVETCMKFARAYAVRKGETKRRHFISHNPSYHGATLGALSLTGDVSMDEMFGAICPASPKIPAPLSYRQPDGHDAESYARYSLARLEETINELGAENVLAFIMEPVSGLSSGANAAPDFYYSEVRRICSAYGVILIYDEVLTGSGRTGAFLACQHWPGADPDLVALSKGVSAGYIPLGAMLAPAHMVDLVAETGGFPHAQTYTTTPLACAAGAAVLREIEERDLVGAARRQGALLKRKLQAIAEESPIIGDVRGRGLLLAIEIVADKEIKKALPLHVNSPARIAEVAMDNGLALYPRRTNGGKFGEWLMITPPLIITEEQVLDLAERLDKTLRQSADLFARERVL
jgi:adenosylmethionine-8-amino-7-oxononanoate aminotransferase